jgi:lysyl-tRNA synthetase class 1
MFWSDRIAQEIITSGAHKPYWVDDMFTPSGFAHIGSLRGPIVHDLVYRSLVDTKATTTFTYVFNDFDPVDGLPTELERMASELGKPLRMAKSPEAGFASFAEYFTKDFQKVLLDLGVRAEFRYSWDMYHEGLFDGVIREALDNATLIQDIYQRVSGSKKRDKGWLPLQVICEKCGKLGTTRVHDWDGKTIEYTCEPNMVTWAAGCGYTGRTSPFTDKDNPAHHPGKLPWKVDWPAHWKVLGVTIEGAGKDHSSAGGSRDIAKELCREVFHIDNPYNLPYEFFLIGGKKMSSSKGLGLKGRDLTKLLPPEVGRFLFTRTDYRQAIEFDPMGTMAIPDLFDEYDRCWQAYIDGSDEALARAFVLSQINDVPKKTPTFLPRFRDVANFAQLPNVDVVSKFEQMKGSKLTDKEKEIIALRMTYASVWLTHYAPDEYRYQISQKTKDDYQLTSDQWAFLNALSEIWQRVDDPEKMQSELFLLAKSQGIDLKAAFKALYLVVLDKEHGPRAGWLRKQFPVDVVVSRLTLNTRETATTQKSVVATIEKPDFFVIDEALKKEVPSISVGIALIKGVNIQKTNPLLEKEKQEFLAGIQGITTEQLGAYPELVSYRKLYKEMGIDWHSRRPSPEALLRRIAVGKDLYSVNTCVDAYNLIVMKHRVSVGAFDADNVQFPTILRYAGEGDNILLLGDKEPTTYTAREIAYYDEIGGYNIDFNYRDAQRTMVTEETKNIWINVDGVYDISPERVQQTLKESVEIIVKYCGGTVAFEGIVT